MFINFKKRKDRPVAVGGLVGGGLVGGGLVGGVGVVGGVGGLKESHNPHDLRQFGLI